MAEYVKPDIYLGFDGENKKKVIEDLVKRNFVILKGYADDVRAKLVTVLVEGMTHGKGITEIIKDMEAAGVAYGYAAERIARTEIMYGLNKGAMNRYKDTGVERVKWLAGPDDRICPVCNEKNGSVYELKDAPDLPYHPNCRCCWTPYFSEGDKWLDNWADEYQGKTKEHYGIYDDDGNLVGSGVGDENSAVIKENTKDKKVVHNHPDTKKADFSNQDLKYACEHDVKEMVVVTPTGSRISISRPAKGWPDPDSVDLAWNNVRNQYKNEIIQVRKDLAYGKITIDEGMDKMQNLLQPALYKKLGLTEVRS